MRPYRTPHWGRGLRERSVEDLVENIVKLSIDGLHNHLAASLTCRRFATITERTAVIAHTVAAATRRARAACLEAQQVATSARAAEDATKCKVIPFEKAVRGEVSPRAKSGQAGSASSVKGGCTLLRILPTVRSRAVGSTTTSMAHASPAPLPEGCATALACRRKLVQSAVFSATRGHGATIRSTGSACRSADLSGV